MNNDDWGKYPGINLQTQTREAETYTLSISKPIIESEKINQSINDWLEKQEKSFFIVMQDYEDVLDGK